MAVCQNTSRHEGMCLYGDLFKFESSVPFLKFRFNFHENRGEVKIEREWRQKCSLSENHSENGASEYVYPDLVEIEGARWVMSRLR